MLGFDSLKVGVMAILVHRRQSATALTVAICLDLQVEVHPNYQGRKLREVYNQFDRSTQILRGD